MIREIEIEIPQNKEIFGIGKDGERKELIQQSVEEQVEGA